MQVFGDPAAVARQRAILASHCEEIGRNPEEIRVTHLSTALVADSRREVKAAVDRLRPQQAATEHTMERLGPGTVEDQIGRYRLLAEAGVQTAIVSLPGLFEPGALEVFGKVIEAFPPPAPSSGW